MRFGFQPARKSSQFACGTDDAVARGNNGNGIFPIGRPYGTDRFGTFDLFRDLPITARFPEWDGEQSRPNFFLKRKQCRIRTTDAEQDKCPRIAPRPHGLLGKLMVARLG
jgi:hypothetical protein